MQTLIRRFVYHSWSPRVERANSWQKNTRMRAGDVGSSCTCWGPGHGYAGIGVWPHTCDWCYKGIHITSAGVVSFAGKKATVCTAINLDKARFPCRVQPNTESLDCWVEMVQEIGARASALQDTRVPSFQMCQKELRSWIVIWKSWLLPYPTKRLGPPKGLVPLMALIQHTKHKVRPVMDYGELNEQLTHLLLMLMSVQQSWGNGIWGKYIFKFALMNHCGHIRQWYLNVKCIASHGEVSVWVCHCSSWNLSLMKWCPKTRQSRVPHQHMSMTFTSTKI